MSAGFDKLATLLPRLQAISVANGYATDPADVLFGPVPLDETASLPLIRLHWVSSDPESAVPHAPHQKVRLNFLIEGEGSAAPVDFITSCDALAGDIKRAVFGDVTRDLEGRAIDVRFDGQQFIPPDPGTSTYLVRVAGSFTYVDHFNAP